MEKSTILRTTKIGNGFVKEDVLAYINELNSEIEMLGGKTDKTINLRTTIGGGFVKEDVLAYIDKLNSKIIDLKEKKDSARQELSIDDLDDLDDFDDLLALFGVEQESESVSEKTNKVAFRRATEERK